MREEEDRMIWFTVLIRFHHQKQMLLIDQGTHTTLTMANSSELALTHALWTPERARAAPFVTWHEGKPYVGDRLLIMNGENGQELFRSEDAKLPPNIGYLRLYSVLQRKYGAAKLPRAQVDAGFHGPSGGPSALPEA